MEEKSIGFEIKSLNNLIARKIMKDAKLDSGINITHVQVKILHYLFSHQDHPVYQRDIEKELSIRRSTVSGIIKTMEKNNFIERVTSKEDARLKQIVISENIKKFPSSFKQKADQFDQLLSKDIPKEELEIFFKVVNQMKQNISI